MRAHGRLLLLMACAGLLCAPAGAVASPPVITATLVGTAGQNGWFTSDVAVNWSFGTVLSSTGCDTRLLDTETKGTEVTCSATNADGESHSTARVKIDKTPPQSLVATPDRNPDRNGWYVQPLRVTYSGTDTVSGISTCTTATYAGPDAATASVTGTCTDMAGNVSATVPFAFRYDATPPPPAPITAQPGDASATLSWAPSPDTTRLQLTRSPGVGGAPSTVVYTGAERSFDDSKLTNGIDYRYTLTAFDDAGNSADSAAVVTPAAPPILTLASKTTNHRLSKPPQLRWKPIRGARYYNVQIFRGGHKILSAWPRHARMRVHASWLYRGTRRRLVAGHYRWYVWPGYGRLGSRRYGRLLGRNEFAIVAQP